jgi:type IV fimbrial biogenesis protein FimT
MKKKSCRGFNFLELMIALTIGGILFLAVLPVMRDLMVRNNALVEVNSIFSALQFTRSKAITSGEIITFCKSLDRKKCGGDWQSGAIVIDKNHNVLQVVEPVRAGYKLVWHSSLKKNDALEFLPSGTTNGQQGSFLYCPPPNMQQYARAIIVNMQGRIYISKRTAEGEEIKC